MTRYETAIEERGEPSLVYLRRAHGGAPTELLIVEDGKTKIYHISEERLLRLVADGAQYLATRRK